MLPFIDVLNVRLKKASEVALDTHGDEGRDKKANSQRARAVAKESPLPQLRQGVDVQGGAGRDDMRELREGGVMANKPELTTRIIQEIYDDLLRGEVVSIEIQDEKPLDSDSGQPLKIIRIEYFRKGL